MPDRSIALIKLFRCLKPRPCYLSANLFDSPSSRAALDADSPVELEIVGKAAAEGAKALREQAHPG